MSDYREVFGEKVALGLGLESPSLPVEDSVADYAADPAEAFSRAAARLLPPGGAVPVPFATYLKGGRHERHEAPGHQSADLVAGLPHPDRRSGRPARLDVSTADARQRNSHT